MSEDNEQRARESLLRSYSSKSVAHGTYLLTIAIGAFAFIEIALPPEPGDYLKMIFAAVVLGGFSTIGLIMLFQSVFWGMMLETIACVRPTDKEKVAQWVKNCAKQGEVEITLLFRLDDAAYKLVRKYHKIRSFFAGRWLTEKNVVLTWLLLWLVSAALMFLSIVLLAS